MPSWSRIATRMRVPLGFLFAAAYFWFAHPSWISIGIGAIVTVSGIFVRAIASGHIRKNAALTMTGPYAYTRNPLYLGSVLIAVGFMVAARNWWIAAGALLMFVVIYIPVIRAEEKYLRSIFQDYDQYAAHVPRLFPRLTAYRPVSSSPTSDSGETGGRFSMDLYRRHREYQAALGSLGMFGALVAKIFWPIH